MLLGLLTVFTGISLGINTLVPNVMLSADGSKRSLLAARIGVSASAIFAIGGIFAIGNLFIGWLIILLGTIVQYLALHVPEYVYQKNN